MEAYLGNFFNSYGIAWLVFFLTVFPFVAYGHGWRTAVKATALTGVFVTFIVSVVLLIYLALLP